MMYLDSCILVKLLVPESDSLQFEAVLRDRAISSLELARLEVRSSLYGKERLGLVGQNDADRAISALNGWVETEQLVLHPLSGEVFSKAGEIMKRCHPEVPLRTLDALHVAACDLSQDFPLCTTDRRMREAARMLGIPVFPEEAEA